jgi:hypothetical protein
MSSRSRFLQVDPRKKAKISIFASQMCNRPSNFAKAGRL